jgi:hypothetical protein
MAGRSAAERVTPASPSHSIPRRGPDGQVIEFPDSWRPPASRSAPRSRSSAGPRKRRRSWGRSTASRTRTTASSARPDRPLRGRRRPDGRDPPEGHLRPGRGWMDACNSVADTLGGWRLSGLELGPCELGRERPGVMLAAAADVDPRASGGLLRGTSRSGCGTRSNRSALARRYRRERDGAEGIRTPGLLNAIQALFQLSYSPRKFKLRG